MKCKNNALVTICECLPAGRVWTHEVNTVDPELAIRLTLDAHFGHNAFLYHDTCLPEEYGQVKRPWGVGASTSVTRYVHIYVEEL